MNKFKFLLALFAAVVTSINAATLKIPEGTFYFDNTNTEYDVPKFIYGDADVTYIETMKYVKDNIWSIKHTSSQSFYSGKYFFSGTSLESAEWPYSISTIKDYIVNYLDETRTATRDDNISAGYIFTPEKAENWNQGSWSKYDKKPTSSDYCIAGNGEDVSGNWCCGLNWDPSNCPLQKGDSISFTLPAGTYVFKITNGTWYESWGYDDFVQDGSISCSRHDKDNIQFVLTEQHTITIKFNETAETISVIGDGSIPVPPPTIVCSPASSTLPIMYLYTDGGAEIESRDEYIGASFYIDASYAPQYKSVGRADSMLVTQIKGRGNYTWTGFDKKPYRIKLDVKKKLLGLTKDKNYTLLAHADDSDAFLRNTLGFKLSNLFGLDYTPKQSPFELFINDSYNGLYFLTDKIKIGTNRVKITEQPDNATDDNIITGGWLLEIDNYWEDESIQFQMEEKDGDWLRVTCHSPEVMSNKQYQYMYNFLYNTNKAIQDRTNWEKYIDIDTLVNFYLIQEIMGSHESFHGSCYMHKERGANTKLIFGPVWDFGSALHWPSGRHIYENPTWGDTWIDDLATFSSFQDKCKDRWLQIRGILYPELKAEADSFITLINSAATCDLKKWPNYGNAKLEKKKDEILSYLKTRMEWLDTEWGTTDIESYGANASGSISLYPNPTSDLLNISGIEDISEVYISDISGRRVKSLDPSLTQWSIGVEKGTYIVNVVDKSGNYYNGKIVVY